MTTSNEGDGKKVSNDWGQKLTSSTVLAGLLAGVFCVWFLTLRLTPFCLDTGQARPQFGEMFVALNALFSGLAFAVIFFTLNLQRNVLKLQQQNLDHVQDKSKKQAERLEAQQQLMSKQNFEDSFFRLMDTLRYWAKEITAIQARRVKMPSDTREEAFSYLYAEFKGFYSAERDFVLDLDELASAFNRLKRKCPELVNYFGTVAMALFLLDECSVPDKKYFGMFLSSQLTDSEKLLLYYRGLCPELEQIQVMLNKYNVLYGTPTSQLIPADHLKYYPFTFKPVQQKFRGHHT